MPRLSDLRNTSNLENTEILQIIEIRRNWLFNVDSFEVDFGYKSVYYRNSSKLSVQGNAAEGEKTDAGFENRRPVATLEFLLQQVERHDVVGVYVVDGVERLAERRVS